MPLSDDEIRQRAKAWLGDHGDEALPRARGIVARMQAGLELVESTAAP